jgi:hypothetical protein
LEFMMEKLINALIDAQHEMNHAAASATNPHFNSKFVPFEALVDYVKPILLKHGILFQQVSHHTDQGACVETIFYGHGDKLSTGPVMVHADKVTAQGFGSAITYAKRYSLSLATGVGADKDDDAEVAMAPSRQQAKPKPVPQPPKTDPKGDFMLRKGTTTIVSHSTPEALLGACREHLSNAASLDSQEMYASSKKYIHAAYDASQGDTKARLKTLMGLYGDGYGLA